MTSKHRRQGQRIPPQEVARLKEQFLTEFAQTANVLSACEAVGIGRTTVYQWKEHDDVFLVRFNLASDDANDRIRAELYRRAVQGVDKHVVSMGKIVLIEDKQTKEINPLMETVYSDNLLSLLAKARLPEFREKPQVEVNIDIDGVKDSLLAKFATAQDTLEE